MDFTLTPVCSENGHTFTIKQTRHDSCDICYRHRVYYQCTDCEEGRCKSCHRECMKFERDKSNGRAKSKKKNAELSISQTYLDLKTSAQNKLDADNLHEWRVKFSSSEGEIYYYHVVQKSITYDYPKSSVPPPSPREDEMNCHPRHVLTPESPKVRHKSTIGESVCDIYNGVKNRILNLNLY